MKTFKTMASLAFVAFTLAALSACSKTNSSDSPAPAAATPASTCSQSWDGTYRDQYGRTCSNYQTGGNNCVNSRYNQATNSYVDINTGAPLNCNPSGYFGGGNSVPYNGTYQGQSFQGCQGWTQVYNATYVPVDIGNGQLVCMNIAYLGQIYPQVNQYPASYYYSQPLYVCSGLDCGGGGGYYSGGGYTRGCSANVNLGYFSGNVGASLGLCL